MQEILLLNPENATSEEANSYPVREAARAVVIDTESKIALLHVSNHGYYKLPGGGIDEGEDTIAALKRECEEEIGCDIEVTGEVGTIIEWRKFSTLKQISYCYRAKVKGEKGAPHLEQVEIEDGYELVWVSCDEAMRLMQEATYAAKNKEGAEYIVPRDTAFLVAAQKLFGKITI